MIESLLSNPQATMVYLPIFYGFLWFFTVIYAYRTGHRYLAAVITLVYWVAWIDTLWWSAGALGAAQGIIFLGYWFYASHRVCRLAALIVCLMSVNNFTFSMIDPVSALDAYRLGINNAFWLVLCAMSIFFSYHTRQNKGHFRNETGAGNGYFLAKTAVKGLSNGDLARAESKASSAYH